MIHILKIEEKYFLEIYLGNKRFELRKNDRDYQVGDIIHFVDINGKEFPLCPKNFYYVSYVLKNVPQYGLDKKYCVLSLKKLKVNFFYE